MVGRDIAAVAGALLVVYTGWSVVGTLVVPRRVAAGWLGRHRAR